MSPSGLPMITRRGILLGLIAWLALPAMLAAQTPPPRGLSIPSLTVAAGENVVVPVELSSAEALTLLAFDVVYSPAQELCSALIAPGAIAVRRAGRTVADPEEDANQCDTGKIRVVLFDLRGEAVIPSGSGPVVEVVLGATTGAAYANVQLSVANVEASNGPGMVSIPNLTDPPATLTVGTPPTTTTTTTPTTTTLPSTEVRCCVAEACSVRTPGSCASAGGVDLGPGSCEPDPCIRTPVIPPGCPVAATDASVTCRLGDLSALVSKAGSPKKLLGPLHKAESRLGRLAQVRTSGRKPKVRGVLRQAAGALNVFRKQLRSKKVTRLVGDAAVAEMLALVDPLRADLQSLAAAAR